MSARILVVDDVPANVKVLEAKLSAEYYDVITASDGYEALERIADSQPDIVLLDVMMPGLDGLEVCRRIKADRRSMHLPVVMVTALSEASDRVRGLEAGADDFLTKPVDDLSLFARVRSLVRLKMMMDELQLRRRTREQFGVVEEGPTLAEEDTSAASILIVDDYGPIAKQLEATLVGDGHRVEVVADGEHGLARATSGDFDLFVVSLSLQSDDPLRLCSQLRSNETSRNIPILVVVDEEDRERLAKGLELGVNDYLAHPVDRNELLARARTQIRRRRYQEHLRDTYSRSITMALLDPLTGIYNRRYLDTHLAALLADTSERARAVSLLILDIDFFKKINDEHGHAAGDEVLKAVAARVADRLRGFDTFARFGGEEFVVVMPETGLDMAAGVAERIRAAMAETPIPVRGKGSVSVTVSIGVAMSGPEETPEAVLERADRALYRAKDNGRDRVEIDGMDERGATRSLSVAL